MSASRRAGRAPGHESPAPVAVRLERAVVEAARVMVGADDRRARIAWSRVVEPGRERAALTHDPLQRQVLELGPVEAWHRFVAGSLGVSEGLRARVPEVDVDGELGRLRQLGARTLIPADEEWPDRLVGEDAPHLLHVRGHGRLDELVERSVAVVGSRASTGYGEHMARELGAGAARRGWTVVSGGAYGIDVAAHRGALAVDGPCVVVLPCGIDRVYPVGHRDVVAQVAATGLVVTEQPTGATGRRNRFLTRNRIIAGLSAATCVVEAGLRSGSLNTAGWAASMYRPVAAVPGPVTSMSSAGCHHSIRQGEAVLVTDADELIGLAAPIGDLVEADPLELARSAARPADALGPTERRLHDALRVGTARTVEQVAREAMLPVEEVLDHLGVLELDGWAVRDDGRWRRGR